MRTIKSAIIGCGNIFSMHAQAVVNHKDAEFYCVCDIDEEKLKKAAAEYNCKAYTNFDDVINDKNVDVVHICTPHYLHIPMIMAASEKGKKIVVEKPMALNMAQLRDAAKDLKTENICAILQNRYSRCERRVIEITKSKEFGELKCLKGFITWKKGKEYYASGDWRGKWATEGGGLVINQCLHMIDILSYIGGGAEYVKASTDTRVLGDIIEVEDTAEATMFFKNGTRAHFFGTNTYGINSQYDLEVCFENAVLRQIYDKLFVIKGTDMQLIEENAKPASSEKDYWGSCHDEAIGRFYDNILGKGTEYTTFDDAIMSVALVDAIYKSSKTGEKVKIQSL